MIPALGNTDQCQNVYIFRDLAHYAVGYKTKKVNSMEQVQHKTGQTYCTV